MLYFQIVGYGESVRVNHPEKEWLYYADNKPVGELLIPEVVTHEGRLYRGGNRIECLLWMRLCDATSFHGCVLMKEAKNRKIIDYGWIYWRRKNRLDEKISH